MTTQTKKNPAWQGGVRGSKWAADHHEHNNYCVNWSHSTHLYLDELDRRREAAKRMPPLDCGRRDPWIGAS